MALYYDHTRVYATNTYHVKSRIVEDPEFVCLKIRDKYDTRTLRGFDQAVDEAVRWYNDPVEADLEPSLAPSIHGRARKR